MESLYDSLRKDLTSRKINTVEQLFSLDKQIIKLQLLPLYSIIAFGFGVRHEGLTSRIESLIMAHLFEPFKPLIAVILSDEAKSNDEMSNLIMECFAPSSKDPSPAPTPVKTNALSSHLNSSSHLHHFMHALRFDLNDSTYNKVPGLLEHFIQQSTIDPASLLQDHKDFINEKFEEKLKDTNERTILDWITPLVERLSCSLGASTSRTWRCQPTKPLAGVDGIRKLDAAIMSQISENTNHIADVMVPVELKNDSDLFKDAALCLAKYACDVFKGQPTRRYVVGFTLCGTSIQLWMFDRSGAMGSESFDIKENKENLHKFLSLIVLFLTSNEQLLGFDPTFIPFKRDASTPKSEIIHIKINTKPNPQTLVIRKLIFRASGICGRGTTCWEAHLDGDESTSFLIKDSWQPPNREEEGVMLRDVTEKNVPNVARYHHHETVYVGSQMADIKTYLRGNINFESGQRLRFPPIRSDASTEPTDPPEAADFTNRIHRRLILKDVGQPIWKVNSPARLLEAFEGCIKGHQGLWNAGYLHRDISINNLMINNQTNDPDRKSFLIDLDVAIPVANNQDRHARTGTKVFMSISLLKKKNPHDFVDDLESFFWVLIWICIHYPNNDRKETYVTPWHHMQPLLLASTKLGDITEPESLISAFTPLYKESEPLINCVRQLAKILRNEMVREKQAPTLYGEILDLLRKAQGKPTG